MGMESTGEIAVGKGDNVKCVSQTYSHWAPSNLHLQLGISYLHISKTHFPLGCSAFILHFFCTLQFLSKPVPLLTNLISLVLVSQSLQVSTFPWPRISSLRTEEDASHIYQRVQNVFLEREGRPEHNPWAALSLQGHESPSWLSPLRRQRGPRLNTLRNQSSALRELNHIQFHKLCLQLLHLSCKHRGFLLRTLSLKLI